MTGEAWFDAARDFGAVGDGVTDASPALANAIAAAGSRNIPLVIPPGRYRITQQLLITSNVTIFGYGAALLNYTDVPDEQAYLGAPLNIGIVGPPQRIERVRIYGIEVDGRRDFHGLGRAGLRISGDIHDVLVKDCNLHHNTGDGWFTVSVVDYDAAVPTNCVFEDVICHQNARQGASICIGRHIVVRGGSYSFTEGTTPGAGIDVEPDYPGTACEDILIDGVEFRGNAGYGFLCDYAAEGTSPVRNVRVTNCTMDQNGLPGITIRGGRSLSFHNCMISGNGGPGVELDMYENSPLVDLHFDSCTILDNRDGGVFSAPVTEAARGLSWRFTNVSIVDNGTDEPGRFHGMQFGGTIDDILVTGCTITNRDSENQSYGLVTAAGVTRLRADLNNLSGNVDGPHVLGDDEETRRYGPSNLE